MADAVSTTGLGKMYKQFLAKWKNIAVLMHLGELLEWDHQTYMTKGEDQTRAEQMAYVAGAMHNHLIDPELSRLVLRLEEHAGIGYLNKIQSSNVCEAARQIKQTTALPAELVLAFAKETALAHNVWREARKNNDWNLFKPALKNILALTREKAEALMHAGIGSSVYEALFNEYEWGIPLSRVDDVFRRLKDELPPMVKKVLAAEYQPDDSVLFRDYDEKTQDVFSRELLGSIGYDWERGRLDIATHPFSCAPGYASTRITSRYRKDYVGDSIFSAIHEMGHAFYEQGLPAEWAFTPMGLACGLSIHESQSRFWDAWLGRSYEFWGHFYPQLKKHFPDQLSGCDVRKFYEAVNKTKVGFIRVDSDPLTYNLHILLRYDFEKMMMDGDVSFDDLPELWNDKFESYFGIRPPDNKLGILQDVHWSGGAFGYFPTYTLGNIISAQLYSRIKEDIPDFLENASKGCFSEIRDWLGAKIHQHGRLYSAGELVEIATGQDLSVDVFMEELKLRYSDIYKIKF